MSASTDLTTLAKVKSYLNVSGTDHDTLLEALIDSVSEAVEQYCGREFARQARTEIADGRGMATLVLRCRPVASVESVHDDPSRAFDDGTLVDPQRYTFYPEEGLLVLTSGVFAAGVRNVRVLYTAGYATIPPAVEQAANILVAHFFNRGRQGGDGVASESMGAYTVSYDTAEWPVAARGLLTEYREVHI